MTGFAEVAPDVHRLGDRLVNWWLIVDGDAATLVDAGLPGQYEQLPRLLEGLGLRADAVKAVLATHGHIDHLGCVPRVDAPVYVPRGDQALAASKPGLDPKVLRHSLHRSAILTAISYARQGVLSAQPVRDSRPLDDGETVDVPGSPRFLHAPGHTDGGMFLLADRATLLSGDVLVTLDPFSGRTGPRTLPAFDNADHAAALDALDVAGRTGATHVLPGHGEPWHGAASEAAALARAASS